MLRILEETEHLKKKNNCGKYHIVYAATVSLTFHLYLPKLFRHYKLSTFPHTQE